ncbi:MAG: hypothetical protein U0Q07_00785 [Acidimicrobiales bacterium]
MGRFVDHLVERERRRDLVVPPERFASPSARAALRRSAWGRGLTLVASLALVVLLGWGPQGAAAMAGWVLAAVGVVAGVGLWLSAVVSLARLEGPAEAAADGVLGGRAPMERPDAGAADDGAGQGDDGVDGVAAG